MLKKLHLGSGRLEKLDSIRLEKFLTLDWINLGDIELKNPNNRQLQVVDYSKTNFIPFNYKSGDYLPFEDKSLSFIFSEHFFEHLFLDESISLFKECYRVLIDKGVMRVVVPDADLRPIPEKLGFPSDSIGYDRPEKHKTRWSAYNLKPALEIAGFEVNPIKYYDLNKKLHDQISNLEIDFYHNCFNMETIKDFNMIKRHNSLIMDGLK